MSVKSTPSALLAWFLLFSCASLAPAENWPRFRGPEGNAVSTESPLPERWNRMKNIAWSVEIPGEGSSSPIVWGKRIFVTSAFDDGARRAVHCLDRDTGRIVWSREITDEWPELTSSMTGHAAATPVTDGRCVVAFFGNAGVVCHDFAGRRRWHVRLGRFESELGLASSPILIGDTVILVCDHDGDRFNSFDSFLIALDLETGKQRWKTDRRGLYRSWSTPILIPGSDGADQLIVNGQDALRAYDPKNGRALWQVDGMTGWVTPSPVFGAGLLFATSGKNGPTLALRLDGDRPVPQVVWKQERVGPYVCSPLLYHGRLYTHTEQGILTCRDAVTGKVAYRTRLPGKFTASPVAGAGKIYASNEAGVTYVLRAGPDFDLIARNPLEEYTLASPAISAGSLFIRTERRLYRIVRGPHGATKAP